MIVWFLTGAWHGASWNFILWGLFFGVILIVEKLFLLKWLEKAGSFISHLYTLFLVLISWVIFAFEDLQQIGTYLAAMFHLQGIPLINGEALYYIRNYGVWIVIGCALSLPFLWNGLKKLEQKNSILSSIAVSMFFMVILLLCTANLVGDTYNPFLYFRF